MKTSMILLTFFALAVASALGGGKHEKMHAEFRKCVEDSGADPELLKKMMKGEDVDIDDKIKSFNLCMMKAHKLMAEDGTVDVELAKSQIPADAPHRDQIVAAIDACANEKGPDERETAHAIGMCMRKHLKGIHGKE